MKKLVVFLAVFALSGITQAQDFADLVEKVDKSVVTIYVVEKHSSGSGDPYKKTSAEGLGAGVVVGGREGWVLTAAHVVDKASKITVEFYNGTQVEAKIRRSSRMADVALLQLNVLPQDIPSVKLGDSDKMRIGDDVFLIGAPLGLTHSVSKGIISGRRSEKMLTSDLNMMEFFQTDASINKGNSGGPMFNLDGEVIGVVSSILSFSGGFEGLGFAASSNIARDILGSRSSVWFGIEAVPLNEELCNVFNIPQNGAIMVTGVTENSSAYFMGLKGGYLNINIGGQDLMLGGDVILSFDGISLNSMEKLEELKAHLEKVEKYHSYELVILRKGEKQTLKWSLTE